MHTTSPTLMMSSRACDPTSSGCASTSQMLDMQWSHDLSSSSWVSLSSSSLTSFSPMSQPVVPTM
ncbi:hypothetical protein GW17_00003227 [Ensete ventricosum]|nr:hypothetical protein GW17_00003227 [Ensete ventricosum]RZS14461.1 hypothetical protein BHM03_00046155 [Ensete ventricosum]